MDGFFRVDGTGEVKRRSVAKKARTSSLLHWSLHARRDGGARGKGESSSSRHRRLCETGMAKPETWRCGFWQNKSPCKLKKSVIHLDRQLVRLTRTVLQASFVVVLLSRSLISQRKSRVAYALFTVEFSSRAEFDGGSHEVSGELRGTCEVGVRGA